MLVFDLHTLSDPGKQGAERIGPLGKTCMLLSEKKNTQSNHSLRFAIIINKYDASVSFCYDLSQLLFPN